MHYCSTRNVIKRPPNANNTSPSSNVSVDSRISPPLPFGLPNQSSAQPFVALPTNPVLIIPYAIIQGGSMLSGSVTSNLSTQDGVYILLQDGSIQMVAQGIPSQPPRLPEASSPVLQPLLTANNNQVGKCLLEYIFMATQFLIIALLFFTPTLLVHPWLCLTIPGAKITILILSILKKCRK